MKNPLEEPVEKDGRSSTKKSSVEQMKVGRIERGMIECRKDGEKQ